MTVQAVSSGVQRGSDKALRWLIPPFLLIDCVNGALLQLSGSSFALSAVYKLTLLLLMVLSLLHEQAKKTALFAMLLLLLLAGPALNWPELAPRWAIADIQLALKLISPLLAFYYLHSLFQRAPAEARQLCHLTLWLSATVLLANTAAGLAGFGFNAYQPLEGVAQSQERVSELLRNLANNSSWLGKPELIEIVAANATVSNREQRRVSNFKIRVALNRPTGSNAVGQGAAGATSPAPGKV